MPIFLIRQIYYFILERPEINKMNNQERIQCFFNEIELPCKIDQSNTSKLHILINQQVRIIDGFDLPNFMNEQEFIQWMTHINKYKKAG